MFSLKLFNKFHFNFWFEESWPVKEIKRALAINLCASEGESWNIYAITTKEYDITPHVNRYARDKHSMLDLGAEKKICAFYDSLHNLFRIYDFERKIAVYIYPQNYSFSEWEQHSPFREFWHLWALNNNALLIHSGIVSIGDKAVLLPGAGGSGKSTTVLSCLHNNMQTTGDDYNLLYNTGAGFFATPLYSNIKVKSPKPGNSVFHFPFTVNWEKEIVSYAEKIIYYPPRDANIWNVSGTQVVGILCPNISTHSLAPEIKPVKTTELINRLVISSIMQSPFIAKEYLAKSVSLIKNMQTANLYLSANTDDNAACISNWLKEISCS